jgi:hypothetical protein
MAAVVVLISLVSASEIVVIKVNKYSVCLGSPCPCYSGLSRFK